MGKLAINGGDSIRNKSWPKWPVHGKEELESITEVVKSGRWSYSGPKEEEFKKKFANHIGTKYAICAANGTVTLQIALEALNIGYCDEVIVPGITWQATASCCIDVNAIPIIVDIEEDSWCIDAKKIEEAITSRTRAIIITHLYGSNPNMTKIIKIARKNNLYLIEDSAHQHCTIIGGEKVGSFGDIGSFSFQQAKGLTSGEGGALTTNNEELAGKLDALRNCGRKPDWLNEDLEINEEKKFYYKGKGDFIHSGNYRITEFQAAILLCQLERLVDQTKKKDDNAIYLNEKLREIEGIIPMRREKNTQLQSYCLFAFRYKNEYFKGVSVERFREALAGELGFEVFSCDKPLNDFQLYRPLTKKRYYINKSHLRKIDPKRFSLPISENAFKNEGVTFQHQVLLAEKTDMDDIVNAVTKIKENINVLQ